MSLNLAELKNRFQPRTALALTLHSGSLSGGVVSPDVGGNVSHAFSVNTGAGDVLRDAEKAGRELAAALDAAHIRQRRCVVCVPAGWALAASTDLPEVGSEDLRSFLELRAEREFPLSASELRLTHSPYTLADGKRRATLAAIPAKRMEAVEKMLAAAGCRAVSISLALDECLATPEPTLHFLANGSHTEVVITGGGGVVSMRSLPGLGGETVFDPVSFYREMRITLGRLPESIRKQVRTARFGGTPESARKLCAETRAPLARLGIEGTGGKTGTLPAAVNAAQRHLNGKPVPFEFVTPDVSRWQIVLQRFNIQGRRRIAFAAAGAVLLPLLAFLVRSEMEGHYQSKWDGMKKKVAELDALQQKIHRFHPWFESSPQVLPMLESVIAAFPEQGDVWAKSIQCENGRVTCTGCAKNREGLFGLMDRLRARPGVTELQTQQLRGENPLQFTFTFKYTPAP